MIAFELVDNEMNEVHRGSTVRYTLLRRTSSVVPRQVVQVGGSFGSFPSVSGSSSHERQQQ